MPNAISSGARGLRRVLRFAAVVVVTVLATSMSGLRAQTLAQPEKVSDGIVKIGLLLDLSGLYADVTGEGSAHAVRMAIEDFGGKVLGKPIELVYADHQNKPDVAAAKAREWFDNQKVDIIGDVAGSATALAALEVARQKNKIILLSGPGSSRLSNEACAPLAVHYAWDTYALAAGTGRSTQAPAGQLFRSLGHTPLCRALPLGRHHRRPAPPGERRQQHDTAAPVLHWAFLK